MNTELEFTGARRRRIIIAASAGNFAEWYDWGVYGVVATIIAAKFFPGNDPAVALLNTYAVFALGYIARPIGGIFFGWIGDKYGRRRALSISILFTCFGTALMGVLPTYAQIGLLAPVLLLVCRLAQSMGAGGEYASAISFVFEHSPAAKRARNVSTLIATTFIGILCGSLLARVFSSILTKDEYQTFGWRILFLVGLPLAAFGVYLRSKVEESPEFELLVKAREKAKAAATPLRDALRLHWVPIVIFIVCTASYALLSTTITSFLTTFLINVGKLDSTEAYNATIVSNVLVIAGTLVMGPVADKIGLRKALSLTGLVVAILAVPSLALAAGGGVGAFTGGALIGACKGLLALPALLAISQIFPTAVRVTAGALAYNVAQAVFGGTGPIIGVWLNDVTGGPYGLGVYLAVLGLVTAIVAFRARRTFDHDEAVVPVADVVSPEAR
ncbi:MFS transporter [Amycolatopsis sp. NPDC005232]|uniref:MFS transporter n=1 Tax=unclassified Amycolatopsis TaxID=2618356 RepID=UPI001C69D39C|nr:MFS transporter [Amycolatopsis sp. DSM 110486]QYN18035.1 MFS transporter [Amycolatopsis sp. DSM 110486]